MRPLSVGVLALAFALSAAAQDVAGRWRVTFPSQKPAYNLVLTEEDGHLAGTYLNGKETCKVLGGLRVGKAVDFSVRCGAFDVFFYGTASDDGEQFAGTSYTYSRKKYSEQAFVADHIRCFLPEGCADLPRTYIDRHRSVE